MDLSSHWWMAAIESLRWHLEVDQKNTLLTKNASNRPDVNRCCIVGGSQQHFRRPVTQCENLWKEPNRFYLSTQWGLRICGCCLHFFPLTKICEVDYMWAIGKDWCKLAKTSGQKKYRYHIFLHHLLITRSLERIINSFSDVSGKKITSWV